MCNTANSANEIYFSRLCAISASIAISARSNGVCWLRFDLYQQIVCKRSLNTFTKCGTRSATNTNRCWIKPKHNAHICSTRPLKRSTPNCSASIFLTFIAAKNERMSSISSADSGVWQVYPIDINILFSFCMFMFN